MDGCGSQPDGFQRAGPDCSPRGKRRAYRHPRRPSYPWALAFDGSSFFEAVGCDACSGSIQRVPLSGAPAFMTWGGFVAVDGECAYFSTIQAVPPVDGGLGEGIFSVSKSYVTCCETAGQCVPATGSCLVPTDAGPG